MVRHIADQLLVDAELAVGKELHQHGAQQRIVIGGAAQEIVAREALGVIERERELTRNRNSRHRSHASPVYRVLARYCRNAKRNSTPIAAATGTATSRPTKPNR